MYTAFVMILADNNYYKCNISDIFTPEIFYTEISKDRQLFSLKPHN